MQSPLLWSGFGLLFVLLIGQIFEVTLTVTPSTAWTNAIDRLFGHTASGLAIACPDDTIEFQNDLLRMVNLLPDDDVRISLLRHNELTGTERIAELSRRCKAYRTYLDAWEKVHHRRCGSDLILRDNVPTAIRGLDLAHQEKARALHHYDEYRYFMGYLAESLFPWVMPYFSDHTALHRSNWQGRGIVTTTSDTYTGQLIASIRTIRHLGCNLPIEIMYFGENDLSTFSRDLLGALGNVYLRDMSYMIRNTDHGFDGFDVKPLAMLLSSFREAILMDADAFFMQDPNVLFQEPDYVRDGALFFLDRLFWYEPKRNFTPWTEQILPLSRSENLLTNRFWTGEGDHQQESAVVVIDKWKHLIALLMACELNGREQENRDFHANVYGDKETFWIGFELAGDTSYTFHQGGQAIMGHVTNNHPFNNTQPYPEIMCAKQILHLDGNHKPYWFNGGLFDFQPNSSVEDVPMRLEGYLVEQPIVNGKQIWKQHENGAFWCLAGDEVKPFSDEEKALFDFMTQTGKDTGMFLNDDHDSEEEED